MYLHKIELQNTGPIQHLNLDTGLDQGDIIKPIILVGPNGSGKSLVVAHVVNGLLAAQQTAVENPEIEKNKVFKLRSPDYINNNAQYSFARIEFEKNLYYNEWTLNRQKYEFEKTFGFCPNEKSWVNVPSHNNTHIESNFHTKQSDCERLYKDNTILYLPPNRFEDPAWLNIDSVIADAIYEERPNLDRLRKRSLIAKSPLRDVQNWLLDVLYDRSVLDLTVGKFAIPIKGSDGQVDVPLFRGFQGESDQLYRALLQILKIILQTEGDLRFGIGRRHARKVSLMKNDRPMLPNIFQLSSGQSSLIDIFFSIVRDFDYCRTQFNGLDSIRGIVVIDEIDLHLHSLHQRIVLPQLLKLFPKVQFIITSHSPLFVLGLDSEIGRSNFSLIQLPECKEISCERFSEFSVAYSYYKNTLQFEDDLREVFAKSKLPLVLVEGDFDIMYLRKAAQLMNKEDLLSRIQLQNAGGFGGLNKVWKQFDSKLSDVTQVCILLLYDCDIEKKTGSKGKFINRQTIPSIKENPIEVGIENLFPKETIARAKRAKPALIDITPAHTCVVRGEEMEVAGKWSVNVDEKKNLCIWLCDNGELDDFQNFATVFTIMEDYLNEKGKQIGGPES